MKNFKVKRIKNETSLFPNFAIVPTAEEQAITDEQISSIYVEVPVEMPFVFGERITNAAVYIARLVVGKGDLTVFMRNFFLMKELKKTFDEHVMSYAESTQKILWQCLLTQIARMIVSGLDDSEIDLGLSSDDKVFLLLCVHYADENGRFLLNDTLDLDYLKHA